MPKGINLVNKLFHYVRTFLIIYIYLIINHIQFKMKTLFQLNNNKTKYDCKLYKMNFDKCSFILHLDNNEYF